VNARPVDPQGDLANTLGFVDETRGVVWGRGFDAHQRALRQALAQIDISVRLVVLEHRSSWGCSERPVSAHLPR
jgi:hypothetical protein